MMRKTGGMNVVQRHRFARVIRNQQLQKFEMESLYNDYTSSTETD